VQGCGDIVSGEGFTVRRGVSGLVHLLGNLICGHPPAVPGLPVEPFQLQD